MRKHLPAPLLISIALIVTLSAPVLAVESPKLKITTLIQKDKAPTASALLREEYKSKMQTLRLNFQTKLAAIKDTVKKNTVARIDTRILTVNKNRTSEMLVNLDQVSAILDRVATRTASAKSNGKDTSSVEVAIAAARASITTAHNLVVAQVAKQYVITINSDTTLKADVKTVVDSFKADIKATHEAVVAAREAVRAAIQALVKVL